MPCHHYQTQKKLNCNRNSVQFANHQQENDNINTEHIENQVQSSASKKRQSKAKESYNGRNTSKKSSNYFCQERASSSKPVPEFCELHSRNLKSVPLDSFELQREFKHACSICPGDFSHTTCKYCLEDPLDEEIPQESTNGTANNKKHFAQSLCKYCINDAPKEEKDIYDSCKYCLEDIAEEVLDVKDCVSTSSTDSLEEFFAPYSLHRLRKNSCEAADRCAFIYKPQCEHPGRGIAYRNNRRCYCEEPAFCLVNNDVGEIPIHLRNRTTEFIPRLNLPTDLTDMQPSNVTKQNFSSKHSSVMKSCEFCLRNGETDVIYNSHQLRNSRGAITCPILKHYNYGIPPTSGCHLKHHCGLCSPPVLYAPESSGYHDHFCNLDEDLFRLGKRHSKSRENGKQYFDYPKTLGRNHYSNSKFFAGNDRRTSKSDTPCQFCLANGEPSYIYRSHQMRNHAGTTLKCPILKHHLETNC